MSELAWDSVGTGSRANNVWNWHGTGLELVRNWLETRSMGCSVSELGWTGLELAWNWLGTGSLACSMLEMPWHWLGTGSEGAGPGMFGTCSELVRNWLGLASELIRNWQLAPWVALLGTVLERACLVCLNWLGTGSELTAWVAQSRNRPGIGLGMELCPWVFGVVRNWLETCLEPRLKPA